MTKLHIEEVSPKGSTYPLIVNFLHGNPTDEFQTEECLILKNENNHAKTVLTKIENFLYVGDEEEKGLSKTFIVKRNKATGKVRIFETGTVNLKPVINVEKDTTFTAETNNLELSRKFGSKKQRQEMEHREKLKVNVDTVTEQMQNITQEISEDQLDLTIYNQSNTDDLYIPNINRNAVKVEEVYNISDILTEDQFSQICSEIEDKDFTSDLIPWIKNIVTKNRLSDRLKVLVLYADSLLKLYNTIAREITKKTYVICQHSSMLNDIILSNFTSTSNGKRIRPTPYKDKSLCHALVFLLLSNNFKIELDSLCETLKLSPATASLKARVTGASVVTVGSKKVVQLKLPLNTKSTFRRKSAKF